MAWHVPTVLECADSGLFTLACKCACVTVDLSLRGMSILLPQSQYIVMFLQAFLLTSSV